MTKAVLLFSGGLDSILAGKLAQKLGINVQAIYFTSPFFGSEKIIKQAKQLKIPLKVQKIDKEYLKILKKPKHGYGKNMNPCIDCKILMLKQAKKYMNKIKAKFIITGEVLNERPMSQNYKALMNIEKQAGLKNKILRPLSAKLLPTVAEKYIKKSKLLDIQGRQRKHQIDLAKKFKIKSYQTPSGGCLLTEIQFSKRLKDLMKNKRLTPELCELLRYGRHFRSGDSKIIVGRNEQDNKNILKYKKLGIILEPKDIPGPSTLLLGKNIKLAAQLTVSHTKAKTKTKIKYKNKVIEVKPLTRKQVDKLRI